jgi:hypothetical protein
VLPDTLDEDGDDALVGDETGHLVFIDAVVRVKKGRAEVSLVTANALPEVGRG